MKLGPVLVLPTLALRATATALRLFAAGGERLANVLRPGGAEHRPSTTSPPLADRSPTTKPRTAPEAPLPRPLDIPALTARTTPEIIAALDQLSSLDLSDLYEHESKHRRRRAVLDAIEAAAAPPPAAVAPAEDLALIDDVKLPDELVYSTQTPPRSSTTG